MRTKKTIAALSLLTSVLLGGLVAPLWHFAYMAFSDVYAGHGMAASHAMTVSHATTMHVEGQAVDADTDTNHLECPYAAFFLNQAAAVSGESPGVTRSYASTCLTAALASAPHEAAVYIASIRGPPGLVA